MTDSREAVDVLVIGAGASGAAFSWSLSEAGIKVMCLEQGGWVDPASYPTKDPHWELHHQTDYNADPNVRGLPQDYPVNNTESPVAPLMYNAVGGSTIHWSAHFPRFHPSDFRVRTLDGVADDWPLSYHDLVPFYDLNDRMMGVSGLHGDPSNVPRSPRPMPSVDLGPLGDVMIKGFEKLGWHWWVADSAINTRSYDGRGACNNCGPCELGCIPRAKASADVTYWPKALRNGVVLRTGARVREITVDKEGLAHSAVYYDSEGHVQEQRARLVVLACNGIGTPRLLLNSQSGLFPQGLGNVNGLVGKHFMIHPTAFISGVFDEALESHKGPRGCSLFSHQFYETDPTRGFVRGYQFQVSRGSGPLNTAMGGMGGHRVPWGARHHRLFRQRFGHTVGMSICPDDLPEEHNQVTLDPELTDSNGIPAPRIRYTASENTRKVLDHAMARGRELFEAAGAREIRGNPLVRATGWHLMGTARMGADPERSVVDPWGRCHAVPNLFVIDGSILVTGSAVNPTSTIQALALRTADYMKKNARHLLERPVQEARCG